MNSKIAYLTFNDNPSGIYSSQVIDIVKFLRSNFNANIRLIAFISIRNYLKNKNKIKKELADAIVLPMFPKLINWEKNLFLLKIVCFLYSVDTLIARSVFATNLALKIKNKRRVKKVVYDGRGAIKAEWIEYKVVEHPVLLGKIHEYEKNAVLNSDYRIAVSNELVKYWQLEFGYRDNDHVVIPCTLNDLFLNIKFNESEIKYRREKLGYCSNDKVFVFSGILSGWQSVDLLKQFFELLLSKEQNAKILFLSNESDVIDQLIKLYPTRIQRFHLKPEEVPFYLMACDYGVLIREQSVTNQVASPVKFAEYLSCGLKILISENLGDYSSLINMDGNLGYVFSIDSIYNFDIKWEDKFYVRNYALSNFSKKSYEQSFKNII